MIEKNQGESFSRTTKNRGWYKPFHLPHYDTANIYQFITYHLADSLPSEKLQQLEKELVAGDPKQMDTERRKKIESWLDAGHGSCILKYPECARIVIDAWKYFDDERYRLIAWTVMPNHVHVLIQQKEGYKLADVVASWKKFTARKINAFEPPGRVVLQNDPTDQCRSGDQQSRAIQHSHALWQRDYWDRFIRDKNHFEHAVDYILNNAVKAGLAEVPKQWPWCSAYTIQD